MWLRLPAVRGHLSIVPYLSPPSPTIITDGAGKLMFSSFFPVSVLIGRGRKCLDIDLIKLLPRTKSATSALLRVNRETATYMISFDCRRFEHGTHASSIDVQQKCMKRKEARDHDPPPPFLFLKAAAPEDRSRRGRQPRLLSACISRYVG